ncbi:MAG: GTPase ObgE, partial [Flavobacteriia bacterium]
GLGHRFLRHIERNSVLLFLVPADSVDIRNEYEILLNELRKHNPELMDKERLLAISKSDMLDEELISEIERDLPENVPHLFISSIAQTGLTELKDKLWSMLNS